MGCCCSALRRERQRDAEMGWHENNEDAAREMSEADPIESKLELEGAAAPATSLPAELESPVEARQPQMNEVEEPPPYSPGASQPVVMNREPRISDESNRSIRLGRASEDSGFEKRERNSMPEDPGFDDNKYRGVVM